MKSITWQTNSVQTDRPSALHSRARVHRRNCKFARGMIVRTVIERWSAINIA